jgi:superfamily II DNA or RNA helicase
MMKRRPTTQSSKPAFALSEEYRAQVVASAYIGQKGYTIPKSILSKSDEDQIKKELFVRPIVKGVQYGAPGGGDAAFPVYRENANKLYLPRFYGISRYGLPNRCDLEPGNDIAVEFSKPLRDYQEKIIGIYTDYVGKPGPAKGGGAILEVPCGRGKTIMALKIIALLAKKTIILVHKEFLMNQWIERIADFLPGARVGKIQGPIFDVADKDIVIGMIQTLYDKDFGANAFTSFGLTVIDEVHRIGSEQFSKTLLRIVTPYMLGISATVDRKDGLTQVLHMFIGDKIYSEERENDDPVCVRAIEYKTADPVFNEVEYDYRGNPKYSTMVSKLCAYNRRTDFVVRVIRDLVEENPENQIMVLAHQRSILTYLYDAIRHRAIAEVGFYVGGMKQGDLADTETKQIVLATYAMAAEALDIKSLSTLVMITPKTDIVQSVGRILRTKHDSPIIVDIVDQHDLFQKQWFQRRRFYKKCQYRIRQIDSDRYAGMTLDWEKDQTWRRVFEPAPGADSSSSDEEAEPSLASRRCLIDWSEM